MTTDSQTSSLSRELTVLLPETDTEENLNILKEFVPKLGDVTVLTDSEFPNLPTEISDIFRQISEDAQVLYPWEYLLPVLILQFREVLNTYDEVSAVYRKEQTSMLQYIDSLLVQRFKQEPPFTIQRICELLSEPKKCYKSKLKYIRAFEKVMTVSSCAKVHCHTPKRPSSSMSPDSIFSPSAKQMKHECQSVKDPYEYTLDETEGSLTQDQEINRPFRKASASYVSLSLSGEESFPNPTISLLDGRTQRTTRSLSSSDEDSCLTSPQTDVLSINTTSPIRLSCIPFTPLYSPPKRVTKLAMLKSNEVPPEVELTISKFIEEFGNTDVLPVLRGILTFKTFRYKAETQNQMISPYIEKSLSMSLRYKNMECNLSITTLPDTPAEIQFTNLSRDTVRTPRTPIIRFNSSLETSNTFVPTSSYENCPIKLLETSQTREDNPISDTSSRTQLTTIPQINVVRRPNNIPVKLLKILREFVSKLGDVTVLTDSEFPNLPTEISDIFRQISKDAHLLYPWKYLFLVLILQFREVLNTYDEVSAVYRKEQTSMLQYIDSLLVQRFKQEPPFTIQQTCELLSEPKKCYKSKLKYIRAFEKVMTVSSCAKVHCHTPKRPSSSMSPDSIFSPSAKQMKHECQSVKDPYEYTLDETEGSLTQDQEINRPFRKASASYVSLSLSGEKSDTSSGTQLTTIPQINVVRRLNNIPVKLLDTSSGRDILCHNVNLTTPLILASPNCSISLLDTSTPDILASNSRSICQALEFRPSGYRPLCNSAPSKCTFYKLSENAVEISANYLQERIECYNKFSPRMFQLTVCDTCEDGRCQGWRDELKIYHNKLTTIKAEFNNLLHRESIDSVDSFIVINPVESTLPTPSHTVETVPLIEPDNPPSELTPSPHFTHTSKSTPPRSFLGCLETTLSWLYFLVHFLFVLFVIFSIISYRYIRSVNSNLKDYPPQLFNQCFTNQTPSITSF